MRDSQIAEKKIDWSPVYEKKLPDESVFRSLNFEGTIFNEDLLPVYVETLPLTGRCQGFTCGIAQYSNRTSSEKDLVFHPEKIRQ